MADLPPTVEFKTNIPIVITFPWGDFKEGAGQHGPWFKYNVNVGEQRHTLFATQTLQTELQAIGNLKGRTLTICKVEKDAGRKGWEVSFPGQMRGDSGLEEPVQTVPDAPQQATTAPIVVPPKTPATITQNEIHNTAWLAFQWSKKCHEDAGFIVDPADAAMADSVRAWAASILIACCDQRTVLHQHVPAESGENPEPQIERDDDRLLPF